MNTRLKSVIEAYARDHHVTHTEAVAAITADLRHLCDAWAIDYAAADRVGYSHYCEENGVMQHA